MYINKQIIDSKHDSNVFPEASALNILTFVYWQNSFNYLNDSAKIPRKKMIKARIFYLSLESLENL